jgi:hypothetical protein
MFSFNFLCPRKENSGRKTETTDKQHKGVSDLVPLRENTNKEEIN